MARDITVGIDIGTQNVKVVVTELVAGKDRRVPRIIGTGKAESRGMRHGFLMSQADVTKSVANALAQAEKASGVSIKRAFLSVGGIGLSAIACQKPIVVSRGDSEITSLDVEKVLEACERELRTTSAADINNREILHSVPLSYKIDGKPVLGRPQGMKGMKLECRALFITCLKQHLSDIVEAVGDAGVKVDDVMASPLAASLVTLSKTQKIAGCIIADIGAESVSISAFENDLPISLEVLPLGSVDITHDIALGLKISIEEAETLKTSTASTSTIGYPKKKFEEIVDARASEIFELIDVHLKKIGRNGLLPAGIIMIGGGSNLIGIEDIAESALRLPARVARTAFDGDSRGLGSGAWSVAYGLCLFGFNQQTESWLNPEKITTAVRPKNIFSWVKQFLP